MNPANSRFYRPVAPWSGRLILPFYAERRPDGGVFILLENAPKAYRHLLGQYLWVRWHPQSRHRTWIDRATIDLRFDEVTWQTMEKIGTFHPTRLDGWKQVSPLESLAGSRADDDVRVQLDVVEVLQDGPLWVVEIDDEPIQLSGVKKALIQFIAPAGEKRYRVAHYNPKTEGFDASSEVMSFPKAGTVYAVDPVEQSSIENIEKSPLNDGGWYVYGDFDESGTFAVEAIEPVEALQLGPTRMVTGRDETLDYFLDTKWEPMPVGQVRQTLVDNNGAIVPETGRTPEYMKRRTRELWYKGDTALVVHTFGWRGGKRGRNLPFGFVTGHFSFGFATVVTDEFTGKLRFDLVYRQIYAHNRNAIVSGAQYWHQYMGNLERGWMYTIAVSDVVVRLPELTVPYELGDRTFDPLGAIVQQLALMAARYRTGPGNGASVVTPATSCVKDSHQALFAAIAQLREEVFADPTVKQWLEANPKDFHVGRFRRLEALLDDVERSMLIPLGYVPKGWRGDNEDVAIHRNGNFLDLGAMKEALLAWKTMLPRRGEMELMRVLNRHGATSIDCQCAKVGGEVPDIEPQAPTVIL
ncbi:hypothetical protein JJD41_21440 [Oxynema sp. CENA135]|uniref:hypothetical protein n=1 Tax=Oxynema sp. CENA135 TaxID=984206 RepID=UPI00190945E0|nr:hypothetical protein [Oxynema sp. CENA135]MBK4732407.1 hypothetical protein [Oxynema sp. CENA135]